VLTSRKPSSTITSPNQHTESFNTLQLLADAATANSACNEKDNAGVESSDDEANSDDYNGDDEIA